MEFEIRPLYDSYRGWARQLIEKEWGALVVVARGRIYEPAALLGFIAMQGDLPVGLATYRLDEQSCELITLNSVISGIGIGAKLVSAVRKTAVEAGCKRLWLITTNDNVNALGFYQRVGFQIAALHKNAINEYRVLKPQIPIIGQGGIPIRDEIELEMMLEDSSGT
jgi:ribosomal protein S18 acetylase RimI-like enzyme